MKILTKDGEIFEGQELSESEIALANYFLGEPAAIISGGVYLTANERKHIVRFLLDRFTFAAKPQPVWEGIIPAEPTPAGAYAVAVAEAIKSEENDFPL